jgi:cytosine/adenosine deaminase-related metal-dependent hydrolase
MTRRQLIKGACVITVDPVIGTLARGDILIDGERIAAVAPDIEADDVEVIDGTGMIAIPGLVDSHRHLWMTLLRGFVSDGTWSTYGDEIFRGRRPLYRPEDAYIATYAGALEALDGGVTTVLDFADGMTANGQAEESIRALEGSGIRAVFCHGLDGDDGNRMSATRLRRDRLSGDDGRVTMGITTRALEKLPFEETHRDLGLGRNLGVRTITCHAGMGALSRGVRWINALHDADLLGPDLIFSHGQSFDGGELNLLAAAGTTIAISPESEIGQGGDPITWPALEHGVNIALGADSVGSVSGDLFRQMQFALKAGRGTRARALDAQGIAPTEVLIPTAKMLEIATMGGARALGLDDRIGSLTPGKQADIALIRTDRVGLMSGAAPELIVVLKANAGDVASVFVAGKQLKRDGRLLHVDLPAIKAKLESSRDYLDTTFAAT